MERLKRHFCQEPIMRKPTKNKTYLQTVRQGSLLLGLASLSLLSVGFSSWGYGTIVSTSVNIEGNVSDLVELVSANSSSGSGTICKYGFVDQNDQIQTSCVYVFSVSLNQKIAKELSYIVSDSLSFSLTISSITGSNSFVTLFSKAFYSATAFIEYNSIKGSPVTLVASSTLLSGTIPLSGITSNDNESFALDLTFTFDTTKEADLSTYLLTQNQSLDFDFATKLWLTK